MIKVATVATLNLYRKAALIRPIKKKSVKTAFSCHITDQRKILFCPNTQLLFNNSIYSNCAAHIKSRIPYESFAVFPLFPNNHEKKKKKVRN